MAITNSSTELQLCIEMINLLPTVIHGYVFAALCIMTVLVFLTKRKNYYKQCCCMRPGLAIPLNLLDGCEDRWAYASAFGSITNTIIVNLVLEVKFYPGDDQVSAPVKEICVVFLPFFGCLASPSTMVASVMGLFYSATWFAWIVIMTLGCANPFPQLVPGLGVLIQTPILLCQGLLVVKFMVRMVRGFQCHPRMAGVFVPLRIASPTQHAYVSDLLRRKPPPPPPFDEKWYQKAWRKSLVFIDTHIYKLNKRFMYSTRFICTIFMVFMVSFQTFMVFYFGLEAVILEIKDHINGGNFMHWEINEDDVESLKTASTVIHVLWEILTWGIAVLFSIDILFILGRYRKHTLCLYKGDRSFLPRGYTPSSTIKMWSSMMYSGYQIAFKFWGLTLLLFANLLFVAFLGIVVVSVALGYKDIIISLIVIYFIPYAIGVVIRLLQKVMAHFVLLQNKINPDTDKEKPLAVDNRRFLHLTNYFFFITNIAIGLYSCMYRIGVSMALGLFFLGRLDRCVLIPGFESFDKGHMAYLGMLHVEHAHCHPVLRVFCHYLVATTQGLPPNQQSPALKEGTPGRPRAQAGAVVAQANRLGSMPAAPQSLMSRRVRNRWHLLYTLTYNPELSALRKRALAEQRTDQQRIMALLSQHRMVGKLREQLVEAGKWQPVYEARIDDIVQEHVDEIYTKLINAEESQDRNSTAASHAPPYHGMTSAIQSHQGWASEGLVYKDVTLAPNHVPVNGDVVHMIVPGHGDAVFGGVDNALYGCQRELVGDDDGDLSGYMNVGQVRRSMYQ